MVEIAERNERRVDPRRFGHRVAYEIAGTIAQHGIAAARHGGRDMPPVAGHEQVTLYGLVHDKVLARSRARVRRRRAN